MATARRIYVVTNSTSGKRLVRSATGAQAIGHVVRSSYSAKVATQEEILELAKTHSVEDAGEQPAAGE
jgi:hypothetical protein